MVFGEHAPRVVGIAGGDFDLVVRALVGDFAILQLVSAEMVAIEEHDYLVGVTLIEIVQQLLLGARS